MINSEPRLLPRQRELYGLLKRKGDVPFTDLYLALGGPADRVDWKDGRSRHYAQSWLSHRIARLNRRLKPHAEQVVPGEKRRTYCLSRIT